MFRDFWLKVSTTIIALATLAFAAWSSAAISSVVLTARKEPVRIEAFAHYENPFVLKH